MPTFTYRALQADGRMADGTAEASSRPEAMRVIEARGLRPVRVTEVRGSGSGSRSVKTAPDAATTPTQGRAG